jgi:hypothetical protein
MVEAQLNVTAVFLQVVVVVVARVVQVLLVEGVEGYRRSKKRSVSSCTS